MKKPLLIVEQHPVVKDIDQRIDATKADFKKRYEEFKKEKQAIKEKIWREIFDYCVNADLLPKDAVFEETSLELVNGVLYLGENETASGPAHIIDALKKGISVSSDHPAPRIYVFVNSVSPVATAGGNPYNGTALAEDGKVVATCQSKNLTALKYDLGVTSHQAHDKYKAKYPEGYVVEFVSPIDMKAEKSPGFMATLVKAREAERG